MAERPDSTPDLATIDVPTLVITSDGDRTDPARGHRRRWPARIPGAELVTIEGVGHLSNLEAPDAFDAALAATWRCGLCVSTGPAFGGPPVD